MADGKVGIGEQGTEPAKKGTAQKFIENFVAAKALFVGRELTEEELQKTCSQAKGEWAQQVGSSVRRAGQLGAAGKLEFRAANGKLRRVKDGPKTTADGRVEVTVEDQQEDGSWKEPFSMPWYIRNFPMLLRQPDGSLLQDSAAVLAIVLGQGPA